jgi:hypothetical protein
MPLSIPAHPLTEDERYKIEKQKILKIVYGKIRSIPNRRRIPSLSITL